MTAARARARPACQPNTLQASACGGVGQLCQRAGVAAGPEAGPVDDGVAVYACILRIVGPQVPKPDRHVFLSAPG
jgi:hypothetical protein